MQSEELEALSSIYEGDENFKQVSPTVFQYKVRKSWDLLSKTVNILFLFPVRRWEWSQIVSIGN